MNADAALGIAADFMKLALLLSAPLLAAILLVGLFVSVLQVVTQVQDQSIAFIPKLVLFVLTLMVTAPWMLRKLVAYGTAMFARLSQSTW